MTFLQHCWTLAAAALAVFSFSAHADYLGACRTWGVESENRPQRGQFLPDLQAHSPAMGQKVGKKWTAAVDLQPTIPKSDRLPERSIPLMNHFAPGVGAMDIAARKRAGKMAGRLSTPVVAANQPDAVGIPASSAVARGAGDGYSIYFGTPSGLGFAELLNKDFPHEPVPMRTLRRRADGQGQPAAPDRHCHARTAA